MFQFRIDPSRLTFGDLLDLESGKLPAMAAVMSHCLINEAGEYYSEAEASALIRSIPLGELENVAKKFGEAVEGLRDRAIPPTGGGRSS